MSHYECRNCGEYPDSCMCSRAWKAPTPQNLAREREVTPGEPVVFPPRVIPSEAITMFDVDDTLVTYENSVKNEAEEFLGLAPITQLSIIDPYDGKATTRYAHLPHIKLLKNHKARGAFIIVWSQNGYQWAEAVVKALGLESHVDLIMSKPRLYVDDLPAQEWMGERMYLDPNHPFGKGENE